MHYSDRITLLSFELGTQRQEIRELQIFDQSMADQKHVLASISQMIIAPLCCSFGGIFCSKCMLQ